VRADDARSVVARGGAEERVDGGAMAPFRRAAGEPDDAVVDHQVPKAPTTMMS